MKKGLFYLVMFATLMISCGNKEEKAYKEAINTSSTTILRKYLALYGENGPIEHVEEINNRLNELETDSIDYENVLGSTANISQRYNAEMEYINNHPHGLHIREVDSMRKADEPVYQEWFEAKQAFEAEEERKALYEQKYGEYRDKMKDFGYTNNSAEGNHIAFDIPDENGKGIGLLTPYLGAYYLFNYEIKDNGDIYLKLRTTEVFNRGVAHFYTDCIYVNFDGKEKRFDRVYDPDGYANVMSMIKSGKY